MFVKLREAIQARYDLLAKNQDVLYYKNVDRDKIWEVYLNSFPTETRQEYNCNCCKSFLRQFSGIVAIKNNQVLSIWDIDLKGIDEEYRAAVRNINKYIATLPVGDIFVTDTRKLGTIKNFDSIKNVTWDHFALNLESSRKTVALVNHDSLKGSTRTSREVFKRGLDELTVDSAITVLELIAQKSLYRGEEFKGIVTAFLTLKREYDQLNAAEKEAFSWQVLGGSVTTIRSTVIGSLLIDLSEGVGLDAAVGKFEAKVAPTNYKRPTALITPRMIEEAKKKIQELGFIDSLERRFAVLSDINVEDILFADRTTAISDVFADLAKDTLINPRTLSKVEEISIKDFIEKIVPTSKTIEVLLEQNHFANLVSMVTAVNPDAPTLFKWENPFSWAYTGGITDSLKEKVKAAGGNVEGELRVSLSWYNHDDLDIHVIEPRGNRIYYGSKISPVSGGQLDVDMNAGSGSTRSAVENIIFKDASRMSEGTYTVIVNNFSKRETSNVGFLVEVECRGVIHTFEHKISPSNNGNTEVVKLTYSRLNGMTIDGSTQQTVISKERWGVSTNQFTKVKKIFLSPNHWGSVPFGNKHFMFMLDGCVNDEPVRPFFNEFLKQELNDNRKVFEVMAGKLTIPSSLTQLSGVGFSETQNNNLIVRVTGSFKRTLKINF